MKKTPLKRGEYQLKRSIAYALKRSPLKKTTPIRNKTPSKLAKEAQDRIDHDRQNAFFQNIWDITPSQERRCYETGRLLYGECLSTYFHHILAKELYPQFRFSSWNIILVSAEVHNQYETFPEKCPKIHSLYLELLNKVNTLVP
jgi:hypothetical protein